mmetsp:Transcript_14395/g.31182  ORF Transcript_14395/g.31182 Transcript_14395/m.31182 type:complete len:130 (+) Transcript_14395:333-722(+)
MWKWVKRVVQWIKTINSIKRGRQLASRDDHSPCLASWRQTSQEETLNGSGGNGPEARAGQPPADTGQAHPCNSLEKTSSLAAVCCQNSTLPTNFTLRTESRFLMSKRESWMALTMLPAARQASLCFLQP